MFEPLTKDIPTVTTISQRLLTTLSVSALLLGASMNATQASPEKQAELRTEISELLASQNLQLEDGKIIEIVEKDNYYIATIPSMSAKVNGKKRYTAPGAVINARPKDDENWEMKYKLVSPIRIFGTEANDEMKVFIENDVKIIHRYRGASGATKKEIIVRQSDCSR